MSNKIINGVKFDVVKTIITSKNETIEVRTLHHITKKRLEKITLSIQDKYVNCFLELNNKEVIRLRDALNEWLEE